MTMREKLKMIIIDNIIAMIISAIMAIVSAYMMSQGILPNLKGLWFFMFFIGFAVFMYNLVVLVKVDNLGKRVKRDIKDISDGKIDGKYYEEPLK